MAKLTAEQRRILKPTLAKVEAGDRGEVERAVAAASEAGGSYFIGETLLGLRQREKRAWGVAIVGLALGVIGIGVGAYGVAKNQTEAYLAIVDRDTGTAK